MTMRARPAPSRAYSLVEVAVSTVVVGVMLVAALQATTVAKIGLQHVSDQTGGVMLAQDLMAEILQTAYADPDYGVDSFGLNATAAGTGDRTLFNDVDDYDGWSATPPQRRNGSTIPDLDEYGRSVSVDWVEPASPNVPVGYHTGLKRIVVTVTRKKKEVATLTALRSVGFRFLTNLKAVPIDSATGLPTDIVPTIFPAPTLDPNDVFSKSET
jgi:hypothetical protein